jgi:hypothetical protein
MMVTDKPGNHSNLTLLGLGNGLIHLLETLLFQPLLLNLHRLNVRASRVLT